jgi:hypothetical protein
LEFKNTLLVWEKEKVTSYSLQVPYVKVKSEKVETTTHSVSIEINSTNKAFSPSVKSCYINFKTKSIEANSSELYNTKPNSSEFVAFSPLIEKSIPIDE